MRAVKLVLGLGLILSAAASQAHSSELAQMLRTEYAFNEACAREGFKASFLRYLAPDGVMFLPRPTNAQEGIRKQPESKGKLQWYPAYAVISSAGDLGLSTGPWVYTEDSGQGHGHFVTLWRKQSNGEWRAALDIGVNHARLEQPPAPLQADAARQDWPPAKPSAISIADAEKDFARRAAETGYRAAVERMAHGKLRVYRDGHPPATERGEAMKLLDLQADRVGAISDNAAFSSGDLGYAYGVTGSAVFVHVWKHEADGWKLLLDLLKPLDKPQAEANP
jgi:ketosteroid isomerase-like protein